MVLYGRVEMTLPVGEYSKHPDRYLKESASLPATEVKMPFG